MSNSVTELTYQIEVVQKKNYILQQEVSKQTVLLESSQREITHLKKQLGYYEKKYLGASYEDCKKEISYEYSKLKEAYDNLLQKHNKKCSGALYEDYAKLNEQYKKKNSEYEKLKEQYDKLLHEHETNKTQYYNRVNDTNLDTWSLDHMYMVNIV